MAAMDNNDNSNNRDKRYNRLLNNLLDISGRDQAIFTRVNGTSSFDVTTKFGPSFTKKMIEQKTFKLNLEERDLEDLLQEIQLAVDGQEIIDLHNRYKERLFNTKQELLLKNDTFESTKEEIVEKLKVKIQKTKTRWLQFIKQARDINVQENVWPLHIATLFVSIRTKKREIFAPLLLREVKLKLNDTKIIIQSTDDWKINQKLLFIINEEGLGYDADITFVEMSGTEAIIKTMEEFKLEGDFNFVSEFINLKKGEIKNQVIKVHHGTVLGLFKPEGGNLRKMMLDIIEEDQIDDIIDIDPDKNTYRKQIMDYIRNSSEDLVKIQPSNYSQDKALISSLIQDTIIWGPPGTGKSQVISNIIANILYRDLTAVVISQKKAALDVLKKRLGAIAPFVLFALNDNKMVKAKFYKPLQEFIELVEYSNDTGFRNRNSMISEQEIKSLKAINEAKQSGAYNGALKLISELENCTKAKIEYVYDLNHEWKYPERHLDFKTYREELAHLNSITKRGIIFKWWPSGLKNNIIKARRTQSMFEKDINNIIDTAKNVDYKTSMALMEAEDLSRNYEDNLDTNYLANFLSSQILKKVRAWKTNNRDWYKNYKRFANAVRAGRRIPIKFINDHLEMIRELFPVIITTPESSFLTWEKESIDYAILDESSQMFLETGLPILYLAKIKVLAGDLQQMQPTRWFSSREGVDEDDDIPENADSLLSYAFDKGVYQVMLNQNYRSSSAALMTFSSKHFYESKLEAIDSINVAKKPIEVINVPGVWENSINVIEAEQTIKIAEDNLSKYKKIIILTFNIKQRQYIEGRIFDNHPLLINALEEEQLVVRNIENIQGDEADLVIATIIYDETTGMHATYVARAGGKNALNVAITRAKEKMIVIKSVTGNKIKGGNSPDLLAFKEWLNFLDLEEDKQRSYSALDETEQEGFKLVEGSGACDSSFEVDVIHFLMDHLMTSVKTKLIKQYEVGSRKIDIAIIRDDTKQFLLGIEVDGYRYHGGMGIDKYLDDWSRQDFLEAKGYKIYRIKEIDWKINKQKILNDISHLVKYAL